MNSNLISKFDPFENPYPGMDMDEIAQTHIEDRDPPEVADHNVIEHGRNAISHFTHLTEKGVVQQLKQSGLSIDQIENNLATILCAAGPRFAHILGGVRQTGLN